jgi:hypothetical protein
MPKLACTMTLAALALLPALPLAAESAIPDLRGTWKGESESIVLGGGNPHHTGTPPSEPQLRSVPFTLTVDKQDGRRFSGTFSSPRSSEKVVAVISRNGTIFVVDDEGYTVGTILGPTRMEWCYMHVSTAARIASCSELVKQP